jgi:hypothetical protein
VATAIGEESFIDQNGNGVFDTAESAFFTDLPEAFRDDNESGVYEAGVGGDGFFLDFNTDGLYTVADGLYNGLLCAAGGLCAATETVGISDQAVIVMSSSTLVLIPSVDPLDLTGGASSVTFAVTDINGNAPPAGTVIKADSTTNGQLIGPTSFTVPDICAPIPAPYLATFNLDADTTSSSGLLFVSATTPRGLVNASNIGVDD